MNIPYKNKLIKPYVIIKNRHFLKQTSNKLVLINIPPAKKSLSCIQILRKYFILSKKTVILRYFSNVICIFIVNLTIISNFTRRQSVFIYQNSSNKQYQTKKYIEYEHNKVEMLKLLI